MNSTGGEHIGHSLFYYLQTILKGTESPEVTVLAAWGGGRWLGWHSVTFNLLNPRDIIVISTIIIIVKPVSSEKASCADFLSRCFAFNGRLELKTSFIALSSSPLSSDLATIFELCRVGPGRCSSVTKPKLQPDWSWSSTGRW